MRHDVQRVLLANEFGAGRGHLVALLHLAQALGPGWVFDAALADRLHASVLAPLNACVFDGPRLVYRQAHRTGPNAVPTATWGEYLGDLGFDQVERLREVVAWWRQVLRQRRVALVLADYAPLAQLAARSLGIPCVVTGTGYGLPPASMPTFPCLEEGVEVRLHHEAALLANVNTVAAECGLPALRGLPEVYRADLALVHTLPMMDPYRAWRQERLITPIVHIGDTVADGGDEVFVYFSTRELNEPSVVEALEALPWPKRGYLPTAKPDVTERLAASGMHIETEPVPVDLIARRSRLMLNAGQNGTLSMGMLAGLPQVAWPQHREQRFNAMCAQAAGVARMVPPTTIPVGSALMDAVAAVYSDDGMAQRARCLAAELRATLTVPPAQQLQQALAPLQADLRSSAIRG